MRIILIGNYILDRQESMERFAKMLKQGFQPLGHKVEIWRPIPVCGIFVRSTTSGIGKWLGYIDKWILYPLALHWRTRLNNQYNEEVIFHICDHSNSPYLQHLPTSQTVITCHDVLAIRGALGDRDTFCSASVFGRVLQKWIVKNLLIAVRLASVSKQTLEQLHKINENKNITYKKWRVIYNGFNADFSPMYKENAKSLVSKVGIKPEKPYILHVGSCLPRKNRKLLLYMVNALGASWDGYICYAGEDADKDLMRHIYTLGLQERVIFVVKPDDITLVALYSRCDAFIFPSFSEGFGWPVIEAQACGAPVIASNLEPMPEVSGEAALYANPHNPEEFASAFTSLQCLSIREEVIQNGFANAQRFKTSKMIESYLELYNEV